MGTNTSIFWFRNDLRLADNPALAKACASSDRLLLLALISPEETRTTRWGFPRWSVHRRTFRDQALEGLESEIEKLGRRLLIIEGRPMPVIAALARQTGANRVFCEAIAAPEEIAEIAALRESNLEVHDHWQSSLLHLSQLPFGLDQMPEVFTAFRRAIELENPQVALPVPAIEGFPPMPAGTPELHWAPSRPSKPLGGASFPFGEPAFHGSESAALSHLDRYCASDAPQSYKSTRNEIMGIGYSTKLSPWLAIGALSPRTVHQRLKSHETQYGTNESTYWIWFELLWRDFFRFWSLKHGAQLFRGRGLGRQPLPAHDAIAFDDWRAGATGHCFIDAGMRELEQTGYLSNRMRQIVASYLLHELSCDWRAGAAWFESRLIDYDVYSNQGNWLYLAGRGADPRQGRRFNPDKQAAMYDADGAYRRRWGTEPTASTQEP